MRRFCLSRKVIWWTIHYLRLWEEGGKGLGFFIVVIFVVLAISLFRRFLQNPSAGLHMKPVLPVSMIRRLWMKGPLSWVRLRKFVLEVRSGMFNTV